MLIIRLKSAAVHSNLCSRLRFGLMNDALCEIYWVGPKKHNIGMGYICEGNVDGDAETYVIKHSYR